MSGKKPARTTEPRLGVVYWEAGGEQGPRFRLIEGFKDPDEARRFTNWSGRNSQALRSRTNGEQVAVVEVVDLGTVLAEGDEDRTAEWQEHDRAWREEKAAQERAAREAHEQRIRAEAEAARAAEVLRIANLKLAEEQQARIKRFMAEAEAELATREVSIAGASL